MSLTVASVRTATTIPTPGILPWAPIAGIILFDFKNTVNLSLPLSRISHQYSQAPRRLHLSRRRQRWSDSAAPSAALARNLANAAVALVEALGSRIAEMLAIQSLIIPGSRAFGLVKVGVTWTICIIRISCGERACVAVYHACQCIHSIN